MTCGFLSPPEDFLRLLGTSFLKSLVNLCELHAKFLKALQGRSLGLRRAFAEIAKETFYLSQQTE